MRSGFILDGYPEISPNASAGETARRIRTADHDIAIKLEVPSELIDGNASPAVPRHGAVSTTPEPCERLRVYASLNRRSPRILPAGQAEVVDGVGELADASSPRAAARARAAQTTAAAVPCPHCFPMAPLSPGRSYRRGLVPPCAAVTGSTFAPLLSPRCSSPRSFCGLTGGLLGNAILTLARVLSRRRRARSLAWVEARRPQPPFHAIHYRTATALATCGDIVVSLAQLPLTR